MKSIHTFRKWYNTLGAILLVAMSLMEDVDAKKMRVMRKVHNNNAKVFICKCRGCPRAKRNALCINYIVYCYSSDIAFAIFLFGIFLAAGWCAREFCPRGPIFTPLELDEIRLDRLDDIESSLKSSINTLKVSTLTPKVPNGALFAQQLILFSHQTKLAFHRKKKTQTQTDRDIKRRLGERVEQFNDKGRSMYGEAWDQGDVPVE